MSLLPERIERSKRLMAYTAAAMYGGAALDALIEGLLPGDPRFAVAPAVIAALVVSALVAGGPKLPRPALALLGPLGVALIASALATTPGAGDGAILYVWPVVWTTVFFRRRGAIAILLCIALAHALTLVALPPASSFPARWLDVMVSMCVLALVVITLLERNDRLLVRLTSEARTDALTGLLNRRGFDERAAVELARARRDKSPVAVAVFDIDYFKRINDEWGHEVGDQVLVQTARLIHAHSRDIDITARFGGEEFVVLLPDAERVEAKAFADRIRVALAGSSLGALPSVRVSAGIADGSPPSSIEHLLQGADSALYAAKRAGRNRALVFAPAPDDAPACELRAEVTSLL